jgi:anthranilate synthase/aminodeoxychorismate synthase-like glutamine amidotransferase
MILLLDNYDSFTYNLADYLRQCHAEVRVLRHDLPLADLLTPAWSGVVLSPGPGTPAQAGHLPEVVRRVAGRIPLLGICLGHQAIGEHFGARLCRARLPMHGKLSRIHTDGKGLFEGQPPVQQVVRYHSLIVEKIEVSARTDTGEIMAMRHRQWPVESVQFHPEAVLTTFGIDMIANWVRQQVRKDHSSAC